jgi:hypothetical protein
MAYLVRVSLSPAFLRKRVRLAIGHDLDDLRTQAGIDRAVLDALRRFGVLSPESPKAPRLRLVDPDD